MKLQTIPEDKKLIICDFANTLIIGNDGRIIPRAGSKELLVKLKENNRIIALYSADEEEKVNRVMREIGLRHFYMKKYIDRVYGKSHLVSYDGRKCKDLARVCEDLKVKNLESVMIGDRLNMDGYSAEKAGIDYIIVPKFEENPDFDLRSLAPYWFSVSKK